MRPKMLCMGDESSKLNIKVLKVIYNKFPALKHNFLETEPDSAESAETVSLDDLSSTNPFMPTTKLVQELVNKVTIYLNN